MRPRWASALRPRPACAGERGRRAQSFWRRDPAGALLQRKGAVLFFFFFLEGLGSLSGIWGWWLNRSPVWGGGCRRGGLGEVGPMAELGGAVAAGLGLPSLLFFFFFNVCLSRKSV